MATNIITRSDAEALIQTQLIGAIQQDAPKSSIFMQLARKLPNMTSNKTRMRVLDMLPLAYWVNGDTGMKQTTQQAWDNVWLTAEELAVIVPIPEAVLSDADVDIMGEVQPRVMEAIGQRVDAAVIFGENRPASWRMDILNTARQAGNNVAVGASPNYYDLLLGEGGVISKVEESGRMVNAAIGAMGMRAKLRGIKGTDGHPIFKSDMQGATNYALDGAPMYFPQNGAFDQTKAQLIVGDFSQAGLCHPSGRHREDPRPGRDPGPHDQGDRLQPGTAGHDCSSCRVPHGLGAAESRNPSRSESHLLCVRLSRTHHRRNGADRDLHRQG